MPPRKKPAQETPAAADAGKTYPPPAHGSRTPPTDLPVHPLVAGLAANARGGALAAAIQRAHDGAGVRPAAAGRAILPDAQINAFGTPPDTPPIVTIAGYLGGCVANPHDDSSPWWQVLFLNSTVSKWVTIRIDDILLHSRMQDPTAAFNERDVLWVKADAPMGEGDASMPSEAPFLAGGFVRAGDFSTSLTPFTTASASGLLCEAITPGCCTPKSR
jgi:hypothetical protein